MENLNRLERRSRLDGHEKRLMILIAYVQAYDDNSDVLIVKYITQPGYTFMI